MAKQDTDDIVSAEQCLNNKLESMEINDIYLLKICSYCLKHRDIDQGKLLVCGNCHSVRYCNINCQRLDWSVHKLKCRDISMIDDDIELMFEKSENYLHQGNYQKSKDCLYKLMKDKSKLSEPQYYRAIKQLGCCCELQGKYVDAENLYNEAIAKAENEGNKIEQIDALSKMAHCKMRLEKFDEAEDIIKKLMILMACAVGLTQEIVRINISHSTTLANIYRSKKKFKEAVNLYKNALEIATELEKDLLLVIKNNLANTYLEWNRVADAEMMLRECYEMTECDTHPDHLSICNNFGQVLLTLGKFDEGVKILRYCVSIRRKIIGVSHIDTLLSLNNLAQHHMNQNESLEAEVIYKETLPILEAVKGKTHSHTLVTKHNLGYVLNTQGKYKEAANLFKELIKQKILINDPDIQDAKDELNHALKHL